MSATRLAYERIRGRNTMHFEEYFQCRHQGCMGVASRFLVYWMAKTHFLQLPVVQSSDCDGREMRLGGSLWGASDSRVSLHRSCSSSNSQPRWNKLFSNWVRGWGQPLCRNISNRLVGVRRVWGWDSELVHNRQTFTRSATLRPHVESCGALVERLFSLVLTPRGTNWWEVWKAFADEMQTLFLFRTLGTNLTSQGGDKTRSWTRYRPNVVLCNVLCFGNH
jgi:hypothetical protein